MQITGATIKYALVLLGVGGAAAGLNLTVMDLADQPGVEASQELSPATDLDVVTSPTTPEPLQVIVDVPVVVPDEVVAAAGPAATPSSPTESTTSTSTTVVQRSTAAPPTTTTTQASSTTRVTAATTYLSYEFAGVASEIIVAQHADGSLEFWSVTPNAGWSYYVDENEPHEIEIEFEGNGRDDDEAEWKLEYEHGELRVKRER